MLDEVHEEPTPAKRRKSSSQLTPVKETESAEKRTPDLQQLVKTLSRAAAWPVSVAGAAGDSKSWLKAGSNGLGCEACSWAKLNSPWARAELTAQEKGRTWFVARHCEAKSHIAACEAMFQVARGPSGVALLGAPPLEEFARLLELMAQGKHCDFSFGPSKIRCYSDKVAVMIWSICEVLRSKERKFLAGAATIMLTRDARRQRLVVRYGAAQEKGLKVRAGMMGMKRDHGDDAGSIVSATRCVITELCTEFLNPPHRDFYKGPPAKLDESLLQHILDKIELVVSDAAANELAAGDVGRGRRDPKLESQDAATLLTPNLLIVGKDSAHSFRRTAAAHFVCRSVFR